MSLSLAGILRPPLARKKESAARHNGYCPLPDDHRRDCDAARLYRATAALTARYLIPLAILSASLFSLVLPRPIYDTPWLLWLFTITNVVGVVPTAIDRWHDPRWDEAAEYLSVRQRSCPNARIVPMQQDLNDRTPNTVENYNEAYAYYGPKWNLVLALWTRRRPARFQSTAPTTTGQTTSSRPEKAKRS